jgi:hypothetical protein
MVQQASDYAARSESVALPWRRSRVPEMLPRAVSRQWLRLLTARGPWPETSARTVTRRDTECEHTGTCSLRVRADGLWAGSARSRELRAVPQQLTKDLAHAVSFAAATLTAAGGPFPRRRARLDEVTNAYGQAGMRVVQFDHDRTVGKARHIYIGRSARPRPWVRTSCVNTRIGRRRHGPEERTGEWLGCGGGR